MKSTRPPESQPAGNGSVLVAAHELVKHYARGWRGRDVVPAVDDVSFQIQEHETFGLVGESGSGKSTLARLILHLEPPTSGRVEFGGRDLSTLSHGEMRRLRSQMQVVFQDPVSALNRRKKVGQIVAAPLRVQGNRHAPTVNARVSELLALVGLNPAYASRFPSSLSGGQCQRVGIARALALNPRFVVLDEAVSSVDVSIRAQILNLLRDLQAKLGLTYLFISHDLAIVRYMSSRAAVLYLGRIVESGTRAELFSDPRHPYTHSLMSAIPKPDPDAERSRQRIRIEDVAGAMTLPSGCRFHPRCPVGRNRNVCHTVEPPLEEIGPGHLVACHYPQTVDTILDYAEHGEDATLPPAPKSEYTEGGSTG